MDIIHALIFGVVEGVTEFLPISSTGHLMLASRCMGLDQTEFVKSFEIAIQLGAILAVVVLYWKTLLKGRGIYLKLLAAFIPTAVIGKIFYKAVKGFLLDNTQVVLWALFIGGVALIVFEYLHKEKDSAAGDLSEISYPQALAIGLFQSLAIIPGVSRAAATIVGGLAVGLKRRTIVEFSFLLAIPTMAAAVCLDMLKSANTFNRGQFLVLSIGFVVSFGVALLAIRFLMGFIKRHTFVPFGIYRIVLAVAFWFILR